MDKNVQKEEGISLMDVVRLLLSKIKLLILLVLIGGFIGGAFSVWQTKDVKYYGTQMRFYVNPENPDISSDSGSMNTTGSEYGVYGAYGQHIFDNMVKLLNEDVFAEEMLLRSQDTSDVPEEDKELYKYLPMKDVWANESESDLSDALNKAIDDATDEIKAVIAAEAEIRLAQEAYINATKEQRLAINELHSSWTAVYPGVDYSDKDYDDVEETIDANAKSYAELVEKLKGEDLTDAERAEYTEQSKTYEPYAMLRNAYWNVRRQKIVVAEQKTDLEAASITLDTAKNNAQKPRTKALDLWAQTKQYQKGLNRFASAVDFAFLLTSEDIKDADKFARSFIYVNINVYGESNKAFAKEVYAILSELVPEYVEANMAIPQGYSATNCKRVSRNDGIYQLNQGEAKTQAIKSAFLMALAVGVVACIAIIIIDRSDKRLRDYDVITRDFHVPILGVVPTIEMNENNTAKKGTANKQNKEEK